MHPGKRLQQLEGVVRGRERDTEAAQRALDQIKGTEALTAVQRER